MMKKKTHEPEEANHINDLKPSDNKEHIDVPDTQVSGDQANPAENGALIEDSSPDKVVAEVKTAEEKLAEMQDKYIRLSAEFDNYRKRTLREKIDLSKYASENLILQILPFMDDFERAISHMQNPNDCSAVKEGIDLIYSKFTEFLKQNHIKEIDSLNCPFNTDLHHAVSKIPVQEDDKKGVVVEVVQKWKKEIITRCLGYQKMPRRRRSRRLTGSRH
jgi:molecular chaperone GrpE